VIPYYSEDDHLVDMLSADRAREYVTRGIACAIWSRGQIVRLYRVRPRPTLHERHLRMVRLPEAVTLNRTSGLSWAPQPARAHGGRKGTVEPLGYNKALKPPETF
jgi:hypothetical protein